MREDVDSRNLAARFGVSSLGCALVAIVILLLALGAVVLRALFSVDMSGLRRD